ncbi:MAG: Nif3-like dinuclear metal center hexameric protein [Mycoplasmatales bacterium]|nr:Nif3-like dinuclear metal center hexameric protein [Mycoplasmatales bacterium]
MIKLKKIIDKFNQLYQPSKAEEWDKIGLQYGDVNQKIEKIIIALDLTSDVFKKAIDMRADLIITHHPFLWEETLEEEFEKAPYKRLLHTRLKNTGIALFSIHTNFDQAPDGTSSQIAKGLGFTKIKNIKNSKYGKKIEINMNLHEIENLLKEKFNITTIIKANTDSTINYNCIAIFAGSGDVKEILQSYENDDIDLVITSDIKWSEWISYNEERIPILEISHGTETLFAKKIASILNKKFKEIDVKIINSIEIAKI